MVLVIMCTLINEMFLMRHLKKFFLKLIQMKIMCQVVMMKWTSDLRASQQHFVIFDKIFMQSLLFIRYAFFFFLLCPLVYQYFFFFCNLVKTVNFAAIFDHFGWLMWFKNWYNALYHFPLRIFVELCSFFLKLLLNIVFVKFAFIISI